jgi:hypothetical protein
MAAVTKTNSTHAPSFKRLLLTLLLLLLLVVLIGSVLMISNPTTLRAAIGSLSAAFNGGQLPAFALNSQLNASDRLLVWTGNGASPDKVPASDGGQLVLMDSTGAVEPLIAVPAGSNRVVACGDSATSPDKKQFAFFVGTETGTLYLLTGTRTLASVKDNFQALGCLPGVRFSPDSTRFAYIAYPQDASSSEYASGILHVASVSPVADLVTYEKAVAFDIHNDVVAYVQFFTNDKNEADEAAVSLWDGKNELEVTSLYPDENCRFTSAQIAISPDNKLLVNVGHRCKKGDTRTSARLYVVDPSNGSANQAMSNFQAGAFFPYANSNTLIFSPDGKTVYSTMPDGVSANSTSLIAVDLANANPNNVLLPKYTVVEHYTKPYVWSDDSAPVLSGDGRWLSVVTNTPNNEAKLNVFDLNDVKTPPIVFSAGRRGDSINDVQFAPDNSRLFYVSGGTGSDDNSLFGMELSSGSDFRIKRGNYGHAVLSLDGGTVAAMEWKTVEDPKQPPYLNLALVDVNNKQENLIFTGAKIVDGKVTEQHFIYPLAWRRD